MLDTLAELYPWIKVGHIFSVIAWMAGMLYLPRLYVYHADAEPGSDKSETFKIMERRLLRGIVNPAMIASFVFGGLLMATPGIVDWGSGWIWVKIAMITAMAAMHGYYSRWRRDFEADRNQRSARFYRMMNEIPAVFLVVILVMVVVKPF